MRMYGSDETFEMIKTAVENKRTGHNYFLYDLYQIVEHDCEILFLQHKVIKNNDVRYEIIYETFRDVRKQLASFVEKSQAKKYVEGQRNKLFENIFSCNEKDAMKKYLKTHPNQEETTESEDAAFEDDKTKDSTTEAAMRELGNTNSSDTKLEKAPKKRTRGKKKQIVEVYYEDESSLYITKYKKDGNPRVKYDCQERTSEEDDRVIAIRRGKVYRALERLWSIDKSPDKLMAYAYSEILHPYFDLIYDEDKPSRPRNSGTPSITSEQLNGLTLFKIRNMMINDLFDYFKQKNLPKSLFSALDQELMALDDDGMPYGQHKFTLTATQITYNNHFIRKYLNDAWDEISYQSVKRIA